MLTWALCYLYSIILTSAEEKVEIPLGFIFMAMMCDVFILSIICCIY